MSTGLARATDPATSHAAAKSITGRTENLLLEAFRTYGPMTATEAAKHLPAIYPPTLASALSRLHAHQLIEPSGKTRKSGRGRSQIVWALP